VKKALPINYKKQPNSQYQDWRKKRKEEGREVDNPLVGWLRMEDEKEE